MRKKVLTICKIWSMIYMQLASANLLKNSEENTNENSAGR